MPTLPEPHTSTCPRVRICRRPWIAVNCARVSAAVAKAMKMPDDATPANITKFAATIATPPRPSGVMSP